MMVSMSPRLQQTRAARHAAGKQRNHLDFDEQAVKGIVRSTASDAEIGPVAVQDGPSGIVYVIP